MWYYLHNYFSWLFHTPNNKILISDFPKTFKVLEIAGQISKTFQNLYKPQYLTHPITSENFSLTELVMKRRLYLYMANNNKVNLHFQFLAIFQI